MSSAQNTKRVNLSKRSLTFLCLLMLCVVWMLGGCQSEEKPTNTTTGQQPPAVASEKTTPPPSEPTLTEAGSQTTPAPEAKPTETIAVAPPEPVDRAREEAGEARADSAPKKDMKPRPAPNISRGPSSTSKGRAKIKRARRRPSQPIAPPVAEPMGTEEYKNPGINPWTNTKADSLSTFAIDVDTASYTIARQKLESGVLPPSASVRVEEYVNYFKYNYVSPVETKDPRPFAVNFEAAPSPFGGDSHFVRVGVQGREINKSERKPANLTFLVDVSGSMNNPNKLGLAKRAMHLMVNQLVEGDRVSLVTYAGATRVVLTPTGMSERHKLHAAIEDLTSGGGTSMGDGMLLAYAQASAARQEGSINRVIVLSDGDANIGRTGYEEILKTIEKYVKNENITMTTVGLGTGNYKDDRMEKLANKGNGNYFYIDTFSQAKRVFQEQLTGTLQVIAKDVKIQVDFDPSVVKRYRLIGYENRNIADKDFRNDKVDAGEIGAGHAVTAIYEVEFNANPGASLGTVRIRFKKPEGDVAAESEYPLSNDQLRETFSGSSPDLQMAVSVAAFAEKLRQSPHAKGWTLPQIKKIAHAAAGEDHDRLAFVDMIQRADDLQK